MADCMKIWMPYIKGGSGTDVFSERLALALRTSGHDVVVSVYAQKWQYFPFRLLAARAPEKTDVVISNSWNGFAFKRAGIKLLVIEHLSIFDPEFSKYRSFAQSVFHLGILRHFVALSYKTADELVTVSHFTARSIQKVFPAIKSRVIQNGIDSQFFSVINDGLIIEKDSKKTIKLLFVGNPSKRKGVDMLPRIMQLLGEDYHLRYTLGLQNKSLNFSIPHSTALGSLNADQLLKEYQNADLLIFPSRLEGLPLAVLEAMSCALPVIASNVSSMPEIIQHESNGLLASPDDCEEFVRLIQQISNTEDRLAELGMQARKTVTMHFDFEQMVQHYLQLLELMLAE